MKLLFPFSQKIEYILSPLPSLLYHTNKPFQLASDTLSAGCCLLGLPILKQETIWSHLFTNGLITANLNTKMYFFKNFR